jgi:hypothetical protein
MLSDHESGRVVGDSEEAQLTCSKGNEEVAEIGKLLLTLAGCSLSPPERTASGYRLRLRSDAEIETTLREFVRRDKECCPFLDFTVQRGPQVLQLDVHGPEAASRVHDLCVEFARLGEPRP